ncbi:hypothetical protein AG1IA_03832 [Rhizoctonia solani AG-1 IA]|uniref:Uncharacterized protein n=1 Tax=Thanatephorus cucumeris (strain AG1-IA) TaxID=983506 RepID=L8WVX9_THACA|nr:hypothetical protein AG1IA_03832 [Rhizoctonia solani AG-1 IA]
MESLTVKELEHAVSHAARVEANFLKERPTPRPIFQVLDASHKWGQISWLGQIPGGRYIVIFFRNGVLSVWDVDPEICGCVAWMQTHLSQEDYGQFSVFKLDFPPLHPDVSISQVLDMRIDIPITGLFLEMDCDLDVIAFPEEIILYAEDSDNSVLHTYAIENIRRMLSLVAHHNPQTVARVGGGFPVQSDSSDSSEDESSSDNGSNSPSTMKISLPPKRSCQRRINDRGVGVFGAGYTMLKKSHISSRDRIPYNAYFLYRMSLRQLEEDNGQVRCLTHHFLTPLASPSSTPSTDTSGSSSTYLSANSSLSSPQQPLDDSPLEHTFAHTLEQNAIAKGPTGYDLVSFGEGGTGAIWLAHSQTSSTDSSDDDDESGEMDLEFWVATFASAKPNMVSQGYVRKLRLPRTINPSHTAALDIDDTQGVICIATVRGEVFRLRFD